MNKENNPHRQRRQQKKSSIKNTLFNVINEKCKVSTYEHAVFDVGSVLNHSKINSSMQGHELRERKNRLQQFTRDLVRKLSLHAQYCEELFEIEVRKYEDYYRQIREHINQQEQFGRILIKNERSKMIRIFEEYDNRILHFKKELMRSERYKDIDQEEKIKYFQHHTQIEIGMIRINVPEIEDFRKDFEKYVVNLKEETEKELQETSAFSNRNAALQTSQTSHSNKEKHRQEPERRQPQPKDSRSPQKNVELDELLGCDEELGAKASANSIRRRKYDVGRQNVIKQQDESDDTNSMISDS